MYFPFLPHLCHNDFALATTWPWLKYRETHVKPHKAHRNSTGSTGTNYCCLTQNLLERSPQHVLSFRIAVKVGTINPSLVESVSRLVFLSFTDLSVNGAVNYKNHTKAVSRIKVVSCETRNKGWTTKPTPRSDITRLRRSALNGGYNERHFHRHTSMMTFPTTEINKNGIVMKQITV